MKLWTCTATTLIFCTAALFLFLFLTRAWLHPEPQAPQSVTLGPSSPSSSSGSAPPMMDRHRRTRRSTDTFSSLLKEFIHLLQSFTEGELKQIIGTFVERRARRDLWGPDKKRRSKGTKGRVKACSLRHVEVTVSDLGLGYVSDETFPFKYCSGGCSTHRRNYDITLKHIKNAGLLKAANSGKARYKPCCRPTGYDDFSFLDNNNKYHTIPNVSASQCSCV
ncbi:neurturin-like isoform X2 [Brienomyrus brachyistius]|uniref:neurturin-like isoform X2 n=1 Tax=Brienomyrus brachyistius TaxID=42636 RepID=UPI0020B1F534|nr:neurturin-like isoform X2 [Brienomyrus brachyistius]